MLNFKFEFCKCISKYSNVLGLRDVTFQTISSKFSGKNWKLSSTKLTRKHTDVTVTKLKTGSGGPKTARTADA